MTLAIGPGGAVLVIDAEDAAMLRQLHETVRSFAKNDEAKRNDPNRVSSTTYKDVTLWALGDNAAYAIVDNRLLVGSRPDALKAVLDRRAASGEQSVVSLPGCQAARKTASGAPAWAYVNMAALAQAPDLQRFWKEDTNPLGSLLIARLKGVLRESTWLAAALQIEDGGLTLKLTADGKASDSALTAFAAPAETGQGALPNIVVPRQIAAASVYRDLHAFYANKDRLFPDRTSGLILFENMMGIFFSGRDLTEDVLGETRPEIRVVVAAQEYKNGVEPEVKIPAFAVVFRTRHPQEFHEVVLEAWQKAIGLINTTRGQKGQPGLIFDSTTHDGVRFHIAYYSAAKPDQQDPSGTRLNFRPALAQVGEFLILSSTEGLTNDLIDALKKEAGAGVKPLPATSELAEVDAARVATALRANRATLVRQNMLEHGNSEQQAETEVNLLTAIVERIGKARLDVSTRDGQTQAVLQVKLNLP